MLTKILEVRDKATFIPVLALRLLPEVEAEEYLCHRAGFGRTKYILLTRLYMPSEMNYDPHAWPNRTMKTAHLYIKENWDWLVSGDVIDVEFILGETKVKKLSENKDEYHGY